MLEHAHMLTIVAVLLGLILAGVHIAVALGATAVLGLYFVVGDIGVIRNFVATTAYEALRNYVFAVIPLFMLMGDFLGRSGAARDVYALANRASRWLPGRLAVTTVLSSALFAFVTGVSIASAAAFSRIAYPEMMRHGYQRPFALGTITGSACLGMLIPPSVLMIVWGILAEISIGHLFLAGVVPGLMVAALMIIYVVVRAMVSPELAGEVPRETDRQQQAAVEHPEGDESPPQTSGNEPLGPLLASVGFVFLLIVAVLGSIWYGVATPTEGAGIGAVGGLILALAKGLRLRDLWEVILDVGRTAGPLLILLFCAQLYSRVLSLSGFTHIAQSILVDAGLGPWGVFGVMIAIWLVLGALIDSTSIILLTVPIFAPIARQLGFDPLAFAIMGILTIECGLLTPPFGILVYTVKAAVPDPKVTLSEIFTGALPYCGILLAMVAAIALVPGLATFLPTL